MLMLQIHPADRAQIAFDMNAVFAAELLAELTRNEVQRFFLHRAALDGILRTFRGAGKVFESVL
ncbi:hypothetical protein D3C80_1656420 [compost metagenome]